MAVFNGFLYHCTLRHNTKHHTTALPKHWAEQKSLLPFSLHKSQAPMLSQGATKTKQKLMPGLQKWVFLASVSLAELALEKQPQGNWQEHQVTGTEKGRGGEHWVKFVP